LPPQLGRLSIRLVSLALSFLLDTNAEATMIKTIRFDTNNFPNLPASLCQPTTGTPLDEIDVDIDEFCHVVWEDSFGPVPTPNPAVASLMAVLTTAPAFEFAGAGPGINTETRRSESNKYGRGFCRWLLYKHVNLTYFATINDLIARGFPAPLNNWKISKIRGGDSPDYFCSDNGTTIALGEAKGRLSSITWTAPKQFPEWRNQFNYVEIRDGVNVVQKLKGYIIATQMKCSTQTKTQSKIFAEDPITRGDLDLTPDNAAALQRGIAACHYGDVLTRLGLPVHSAYLRLGATLKEPLNRQAMQWECLIPALQGRRFIGVAYPPTGFPVFSPLFWNAPFLSSPFFDAPLRYFNPMVPHFTFFGLESSVFKAVIEATHSGLASLARAEQLVVPPMPDGTSVLRDGTLLCPLDFMRRDQPIDV
jgi:hypothetical protein